MAFPKDAERDGRVLSGWRYRAPHGFDVARSMPNDVLASRSSLGYDE